MRPLCSLWLGDQGKTLPNMPDFSTKTLKFCLSCK